MRIVHLYHAYKDLLGRLSAWHPEYVSLSAEGKLALLHRYYYYYHGYALEYNALGWEALSLPTNEPGYLSTWARENAVPETDMGSILIAQLRQFRPEVVFFHPFYSDLLARIKAEVPGIRLIVIPANSPNHDPALFQLADLVIGCIPEVVERLQQQGHRAHHVHHGFATHMLQGIGPRHDTGRLAFSGSIIRGADFHYQREELLRKLVQGVGIDLYSPSEAYSKLDELATYAKRMGYNLARRIPEGKSLDKLLSLLRPWRKVRLLHQRPDFPFHPELKPYLKPPVYGAEMFQLMLDARAVVNVHIDMSPRSASNIRMFEATGAGGCLLTDWKENLTQLFEPDSEIVSYRSQDEALEKARYLIRHPEVATTIGEKAALRALKSHRLQDRVADQIEIIKASLA